MRFQAKNCTNSGPNWSFKQMSSGNGRNGGHPYAQMQGMLCLEDGTNGIFVLSETNIHPD